MSARDHHPALPPMPISLADSAAPLRSSLEFRSDGEGYEIRGSIVRKYVSPSEHISISIFLVDAEGQMAPADDQQHAAALVHCWADATRNLLPF